VGALDPSTGLRAAQSNYGPNLDFVAPGVDIYSTDRMGENGLDRANDNWSNGAHPAGDSNDADFVHGGTSFAAPFVTAAAALLVAEHPSLSPNDVYAILCASAHDLGVVGKDDEYGCGLIDIRAALDLAASPDAFADGFDAGNTEGWSGSKSPAMLHVLGAAAQSGAFGLRVDAIPCTEAEHVVVPDGTITSAQLFEACSSITAADVDVVDPGNLELRTSELIALGSGFSVGASAALAAEIDQTLSGRAYVEDDSPSDERALRARFYLRLDQLTMATGDVFDHLQANSSVGDAQLRVRLSKGPGGVSLDVAARLDSGSEVSASPVALAGSGWNRIELEWKSSDIGRSDGHLKLWLEDVEQPGLSGLDNEDGRIDLIRWGVVEGLDSGSNGEIDIDELVWRRVSLHIGA
jgi:hypothetical protein